MLPILFSVSIGCVAQASGSLGRTLPLPGQDEGDMSALDRKIRNQRMHALDEQRQKKLVEDTNKLLLLATQLKEEVDKSTKDTLSITVITRAAEIEKLAKSIKEKMKANNIATPQ